MLSATSASYPYVPGAMPASASTVAAAGMAGLSDGRVGTEFPDFNLLPASERASLKTCLVLAAQQGMVDFSFIPRCPSWLLPPLPQDHGLMSQNSNLNPINSGRSWQDGPRAQQLRELERQNSRASQGSPMYSRASLGAQQLQADSGANLSLSLRLDNSRFSLSKHLAISPILSIIIKRQVLSSTCWPTVERGCIKCLIKGQGLLSNMICTANSAIWTENNLLLARVI